MCHPSIDLSVLLDNLDTELELTSLEQAELIAHQKLKKEPERRHLLALCLRIEQLEFENEQLENEMSKANA